ncbi:MAG: biotin-dependent carboxyltransferase family protein [Woeseiaceae bacterium]
MSLRVKRAGLQTTIQASPRSGQRHLGVPSCGPADPLSMALANRLVGNALTAPVLEVTLTGIEFEFETDTHFAITGAPSPCVLNSRSVKLHETVSVVAGDELRIGAPTSGARAYIAIAGGLAAEEFLGSGSTYLPAGFGGFRGRAVRDDDRLELSPCKHDVKPLATPREFQPPVTGKWAVRACDGAEIDVLNRADLAAVFDTNFTVGARNDRMGLRLEGRVFETDSKGDLPSVPVFPGSVQCPESGSPYLLGVDAQTTGGYPRIAQVARLDLHELGQFRAGDHVRLLRRSPDEATAELREKHAYWRAWLPDIGSVI